VPSTPTLVLIPDAWHGPWVWRGLLDELSDLDVRTIELPSVGPDPAALGDLQADAAAVRAAVRAVGGPVLVCAHAYGAVAASEGLSGLSGVVGLVFLGGLQLDIGESVLGACGGVAPPWWDVHEAEGYVDPRQPERFLYSDVDAAKARSAVARLGHQSLAAFEQRLTRAAWRTVPSTYVVCERDAALPVHAQATMAERATRVLRMSAAHAPFLSRPAQLAGVLRAELSLGRATAAR
jgi:pimeloyl-ACP methyl ester carboxylesterase